MPLNYAVVDFFSFVLCFRQQPHIHHLLSTEWLYEHRLWYIPSKELISCGLIYLDCAISQSVCNNGYELVQGVRKPYIKDVIAIIYRDNGCKYITDHHDGCFRFLHSCRCPGFVTICALVNFRVDLIKTLFLLCGWKHIKGSGKKNKTNRLPKHEQMASRANALKNLLLVRGAKKVVTLATSNKHSFRCDVYSSCSYYTKG